ncbi:hypothetical protein AOLI_G00184950 [Acnodon oligacanthus]
MRDLHKQVRLQAQRSGQGWGSATELNFCTAPLNHLKTPLYSEIPRFGHLLALSRLLERHSSRGGLDPLFWAQLTPLDGQNLGACCGAFLRVWDF